MELSDKRKPSTLEMIKIPEFVGLFSKSYILSDIEKKNSIDYNKLSEAIEYLFEVGNEIERQERANLPFQVRILKSKPLMNVKPTYQKSKIILPNREQSLIELYSLKDIRQFSNTSNGYYHGPFLSEKKLASYFPLKAKLKIISKSKKELEQIVKDLNFPMLDDFDDVGIGSIRIH